MNKIKSFFEKIFLPLLAVVFGILISFIIFLGIDEMAKRFCEFRGGKYISGNTNSMCRFDK